MPRDKSVRSTLVCLPETAGTAPDVKNWPGTVRERQVVEDPLKPSAPIRAKSFVQRGAGFEVAGILVLGL
jgi:hypothetical protein